MRPIGNNITQCPVCGSVCRTLKSDQITESYREVMYVCTSNRCRHVFVAAITPVRTISPSLLTSPPLRAETV